MGYIVESELAGNCDGDFGGGKVACVGNVHVFILHAEFHTDLGVVTKNPDGSYNADGSGFRVGDAFSYHSNTAVCTDGDHFYVSGIVTVDTVGVLYYFAPAMWLVLVCGKLSMTRKRIHF